MSERWATYPAYGGVYEVSTGGGIRVVTRRVGLRWMPGHVLTAAEIAEARLRPDEMARQVWGAQYVPEGPQRVAVDGAAFVSPDAGVTWAREPALMSADAGETWTIEGTESPEFPMGRPAPGYPAPKVEAPAPEPVLAPKRAEPTLPPEAPKEAPKAERKGKRERR